MTTPKFTGTVENGKIQFYGSQKLYLNNWVQTLEGSRIVLTIKKWHPQRTNPQNAYLHGVVFKTIADETGNDLQTVKDTLKDKFASTVDGKGFKHIEKTSKMSTARMVDFIETICRWAATDLDIYVPPPNE